MNREVLGGDLKKEGGECESRELGEHNVSGS